MAFYRQAADKYVEIGDAAKEGVARNNLADTLRKLRRLDEARQEIRRAIACKEPYGHVAEPWKSWAILANIETVSGNAAAAADAQQKAIELYLAYRCDGGENHNRDGRICLAVTELLVAGASSPRTSDDGGAEALGLEAPATEMLNELAARPDLPAWLRPFIAALQQIVAGSRDRTLADNPELNYSMAAEILFLLETLEASGQPRSQGAVNPSPKPSKPYSTGEKALLERRVSPTRPSAPGRTRPSRVVPTRVR